MTPAGRLQAAIEILDEVIASQNKMLIERGEAPDTTADDRMKDIYLQHLKKIERFSEADDRWLIALEGSPRGSLATPTEFL